ncbi:hypothetical protein BDZ89DRAFT_1139731 [Hymenopellis radicata]|nr:hypothetical protein BDZ89DRAFT_1139731 [Hymenopellis radicata]
MQVSRQDRFSFTEDDAYVGRADAKRAVLGFIHQAPGRAPSSQNTLADDLFDTLIEWNGVCLAGTLLECGVQTMSNLRRAACGCTHSDFRKVFRMAFGMDAEDRNWASLGALIRQVGCCDAKFEDPSSSGVHAPLRRNHWDEVNKYLYDVLSRGQLKIKLHLNEDIALARAVERLKEMLRRHGLGNATLDPKCCKCGVRMVSGDDGEAGETTLENATPSTLDTCSELYRCKDCGDFLECRRCSLERHAWSPLHVIQVWRDEYWEHTTLFEMGLVYQIGHQGGRCVYPEPTRRLMTVIHVNGVHTVKYQYCSCDVSDSNEHRQQLLRNGWYPASMAYPATYVMMDVLDHRLRFRSF